MNGKSTVMLDELVDIRARCVARGGYECDCKTSIQEESFLELFLNGRQIVQFSCSARHSIDLAVGHLLTEGFISGVGDIKSLQVDDEKRRIMIAINNRSKAPLQPVTLMAFDAEAIFRISDEFALDKTAHARTRGAHSAFLCDLAGYPLCMREDIGRHNAFDKVVGWALMSGIDLANCMIYTSGRVPSDIASKAVRVGIPILVSKSVATDQGIAIAREYGLTLICEAKPQQFTIATQPSNLLLGF